MLMNSTQVQNAIENFDCIRITMRHSTPLEAVAYVSGNELMPQPHLVLLHYKGQQN
jgi:hypothetical protein